MHVGNGGKPSAIPNRITQERSCSSQSIFLLDAIQAACAGESTADVHGSRAGRGACILPAGLEPGGPYPLRFFGTERDFREYRQLVTERGMQQKGGLSPTK